MLLNLKTLSSRTAFLCLLLFVLTFALYFQILQHPFIYYDVENYITKNRMVQKGLTSISIPWAFTTLSTGDWQPLVWLSYMLDYELFGLRPGGYHFTNLLWHTFNVILVFIFFSRLTRKKWPSFFMALLFAVHPLRVESVAWAAERKDMLSGFFWWLTLIFYIEFRKNEHKRYEIYALVSYALGILSKPIVVSLPIILLLLDYWPLDRLKSIRDFFLRVKEKILFFLFSAFSCFMAVKANTFIDGITSLEVIPLQFRLENMFVAYFAYIQKTFLPFNLSIMYPLPIELGHPIWQVLLSFLLFTAVTFLALKFRNRAPYLLVGWLWYVVTLIPVIGLVQVGRQAIADRYMYIPQVGLALMAIWGILNLPLKGVRKTGLYAGILSILFFTVMAKIQINYWRSSITLHKHATQVTPDNFVAHASLGYAYAKAGQTEKGIEHFRKALEIRPTHVFSISRLATIYFLQKKLDEAERLFKLALSLKPKHAFSHHNLGVLYLAKGNEEAAEHHFLQALAHQKSFMNTRTQLANLYIRQGKLDQAQKMAEATIRRFPRNKDALTLLGNIASKKGHKAAAMDYYRRVIAAHTDAVRARNNLAGILLKKGELDEAKQLLREAIQAEPHSSEPYINLSNILVHQKNYEEAIPLLQEALKIAPDSEIAKKLFNMALTTEDP